MNASGLRAHSADGSCSVSSAASGAASARGSATFMPSQCTFNAAGTMLMCQ